MRDLLTTVASIIVILFCLSLLMVSGEADLEQEEVVSNARQLASYRTEQLPVSRSTVFRKVQSVELENGVLMFTTIEKEGLKEHYFLIRDKNVVLVNNKTSSMPYNTIRFDSKANTLLVTIPTAFEIDMMESLTAK
ncbi:hypothetical protein Pan241w_32250 [Gimesia alba]|uniref:Uncharacterized protein n=1 Tax=Gimesia alba TaxID=2527973 RepID=A0A517RGW7_9PLAN|nr:hypothetical protein [Gimesia alba]QDT43127.1 hypothetical protein Pan241w_32250 [Gimesia alba]